MMGRFTRPEVAAMVAVALFAVASCAGGGSSDDAGLTGADVIDLRDALEDKTHETIVRVLYEDPGARASFIARGEAEPQDAALLAEFTADGEVTFEEFQMLSDVRDAVHHYGGGITTFFEQRAVEAMRTE